MKIHIIGCSGSGKTYLANALSKKYNISYFDLDDIQWDNNAKEYGKKRTLDERKALLQEILYNNDEWIIEWVYYAWVQQSFDEADKIYVLDMPGYLYKSRIIMRSIKRKLGILNGKKETLKSVYNLLKWTETFQNKNLKVGLREVDKEKYGEFAKAFITDINLENFKRKNTPGQADVLDLSDINKYLQWEQKKNYIRKSLKDKVYALIENVKHKVLLFFI